MQLFQLSPFAIPPAVTAAAMMLFAIMLLSRLSRTTVAMFAISVAAAVWQAAFALMDLAIDARAARIWATAGCASALLVAPAVYQFVASILGSASRRRRMVALMGWIVAAAFAILIVT